MKGYFWFVLILLFQIGNLRLALRLVLQVRVVELILAVVFIDLDLGRLFLQSSL